MVEISENDYIRNVVEKIKDIRWIESKIILHYNRGILDENEPSIFSILDIYLKKILLEE